MERKRFLLELNFCSKKTTTQQQQKQQTSMKTKITAGLNF